MNPCHFLQILSVVVSCAQELCITIKVLESFELSVSMGDIDRGKIGKFF